MKFYDPESWTYGAEHELADWCVTQFRTTGAAYSHNNKDYTIVNNNGVANDPKLRVYKFGGEINTRPTGTILEQCAILSDIKKDHPEAAVNYRSNLHIHICVPGLASDIESLKKLQAYIHVHLPKVIGLVEPIPVPRSDEYPNPEHLKGAQKRYKRRKKSHQTFLPEQRVKSQMTARTLDEFFELEVPKSKTGAVMWHAQSRCCVNLRQLLQTGTIEFRHFPGTLSEEELYQSLNWCKRFLYFALNEPKKDINDLVKDFPFHRLPRFAMYNHNLERGYLLTCHDGTVPLPAIKKNIQLILEGGLL